LKGDLALTYRNLIFDLDGTLIEPKTGITRAIAHALKYFGIYLSESDYDSLTPFIGPPLTESFSRYYGFDEARAKDAVAKYREYYSVTGLFECSLYPGITELLTHFHQAGIPIYLATSKPQIFAETLLKHLHLDHFFTLIAGSTLDHTRDQKSQVLDWLLSQEHLKPEECLMIGDRHYDVEGARACGIDTVAVGYGYGSKEEFDACAPAYRAESVEALTELLRRLT